MRIRRVPKEEDEDGGGKMRAQIISSSVRSTATLNESKER